MVVVKCIGTHKDTLRFDNIDDSCNVKHLKQLMSEQLDIQLDMITLKLKGKEIFDDKSITKGMKLIGFIHKSSESSETSSSSNIFDETPVECKGFNKKCGFYGRNDTEGYCSLCFKKKQRQQRQQHNQLEKQSSTQSFKKAKIVSPPLDNKTIRSAQSDTSKCWECKRRIGLLGFECRCGYKFCAKHRYPEQHICGYDYKKHQREELEEKLISHAIENEKISRI